MIKFILTTAALAVLALGALACDEGNPTITDGPPPVPSATPGASSTGNSGSSTGTN